MNGVDDSIWKLLREFSKGDVGMLKIWTKLYEIWKSEFQALFDRMNIPLSLDCNELRVANQMDETLNNLETQGTIKDSVLDFNEFGLGAVNFVENEGKGKMQLSRVALLRESTSENELVYIVASDKSQHLWRRSVKILSELNVDTDAIKLYQVREMQGISLEAVPYTAINDLKKQMLEISTEDRYEACGKAVGRYLNKTNKSAKVAYANTADMVADIVGISTLICREFTVKRTKIHCFDWDAILNSYSEPGIFLQYTHARLCGIERKANPTLNVDADLQSVVKVPGAIEIATTLDRYPAVVNSMKFAPESGVLLKYLLGLAHLVSSANSKLRIKGMGAAIGEGRWLLLWSARVVLESGMEILGLFPLDEV
ncbi:Arginyl-tRNA synthetase [Nowakowskiella sp. JEL0407]|nr:Arginyl-tRNA synthetase [Nowakowskiella sp. JEL0407]